MLRLWVEMIAACSAFFVVGVAACVLIALVMTWKSK
jgi:hypothetical protein